MPLSTQVALALLASHDRVREFLMQRVLIPLSLLAFWMLLIGSTTELLGRLT